jgi:hypothetical protein
MEGGGASSGARGALEVLQKYQRVKIPVRELCTCIMVKTTSALWSRGAIYGYLVESGGLVREGERGVGAGVLALLIRVFFWGL